MSLPGVSTVIYDGCNEVIVYFARAAAKGHVTGTDDIILSGKAGVEAQAPAD
ncbi:hypothetical protein R5H30_18165 [Sulfitobacter sp. D35]|uniref:hypothetical protein n=1 Tax=Sulfitobacter sp. D35 TaxID=3083252 RepID=UPI002970052A|nr:hypothetical protein [Sulfitobacter sp. D35]MDW4499923.1 hypothetical protein [Sulfitobacter sp. D35]